MPQKWPCWRLNWVGRAVLSTDYDGVNVFSYNNTGIYEKKCQSFKKNRIKTAILLQNEPFFICSSTNIQ